jgi:hypothetical protein
MRKRIIQTVNAEVIAFWRSRLAALGEKLAKNRDAADAWFWRVQSDILNYLLHRYGGEAKTASPSTGQGAAMGPVEPANPVPLEFQPSGSFGSAASKGRMPRASGAIRPALENIARGNEERYVMFKRTEEEMAEAMRIHSKERQKWKQSTQVKEWRQWLEEERTKFRLLEEVEEAKIANEGMSEDELFELLSQIVHAEEPPKEGGGHEDTPPVNGTGD